MTTYNEIKETKEYKNDKNCCTVIASSVVFDEDFAKMQLIYDGEGRRRNKGLMPSETRRIFKKLADQRGYQCKQIKQIDMDKFGGVGVTVNRVEAYLDPRKRYFISVKGHIIGAVAGKIQDWTEGRRNRVKEIWELTPPKTEKKVELTQWQKMMMGLK